MSSTVFPTLVGLAFPVGRTPVWSGKLQTSISGKNRGLSFWSYPKWQWDLSFNVLRSDSINLELQNLAGFFNAMNGPYGDTFLYQDADDNSITGQQIGVGDGSNLTFQLVRSFGGFIEPILAPNVVSHVYVDGTDTGHWTISNWGSSTPGLVTFASGHAPTSGKAVTVDYSYYFPCRFLDDTMSFSKFMSQMYEAKKVSFMSEK